MAVEIVAGIPPENPGNTRWYDLFSADSITFLLYQLRKNATVAHIPGGKWIPLPILQFWHPRAKRLREAVSLRPIRGYRPA